ncbi:J domain-containing protein, partial [Patulibacter sp. S7RM1-6]
MAVPSGVDPREVLGVGPDAGTAEVTAAFRRLAKRWHPDHAAGRDAGDRMALLNAAYAALRAPAPVAELEAAR